MELKKNPSCVFCRSGSIENFLNLKEKKYYHCLSCDLVFLYPQPIVDLIDLSNKRQYGQKDQINDYLERKKQYEKKSRMIIRYLKNFVSKKKRVLLLDVGCHYGFFLSQAKKAGFQVFGVEKEKIPADFAREYFSLTVFVADFSKINLKKKFDVITLIDVFEHLPDPNLAVDQIKKHLKENGIVFIQCPNIRSLMFKITKEKWNWLLPDSHLYQFSLKSLLKILSENGFKLISSRTYDDISEFAYNIIDWLGVKKRNIWEKIIWKGLRVFLLLILPLGSFFWSRWGKGGLINAVFIKKTED